MGGCAVRSTADRDFYTQDCAHRRARENRAQNLIRAKSYPNPGFDKAFAAAQSDPLWRTYEVPCGHDVMVDMPERLSELLLEAAA
jgi:hypothetical protein